MSTITQTQEMTVINKLATPMATAGFASPINPFVQARNQEPEFHIPISQKLPLEKRTINYPNGDSDTMYVTKGAEIIPLMAIGTFVLEKKGVLKPILTGLYKNGQTQNLPAYQNDGSYKMVSHVRLFGYVKPDGCEDWILCPFVVRGKGQTQQINKLLVKMGMEAMDNKKNFWGDTIISFKTGDKPTPIKSANGSEQSGVFLIEKGKDTQFPKKIEVDIKMGFKVQQAWLIKLLGNYEIPL